MVKIELRNEDILEQYLGSFLANRGIQRISHLAQLFIEAVFKMRRDLVQVFVKIDADTLRIPVSASVKKSSKVGKSK